MLINPQELLRPEGATLKSPQQSNKVPHAFRPKETDSENQTCPLSTGGVQSEQQHCHQGAPTAFPPLLECTARASLVTFG